MDKEQVYDALIGPQMDQIIAVCKAHGIAMLATFDIPTEADDGLCCTTLLPDGSGQLPDRLRRASREAMRAGGEMMAFTITSKGRGDEGQNGC